MTEMKDVKGYEGLYAVDMLGNVYSVVHDAHRRKRCLKPYNNSNGYLKVNLYDFDGKCKKAYIHRLVAEAFIPNPNGLKEVNHIDCDKSNNHVDNLEWCDRKQNLKHSYDKGLKRTGEKHGMHKLTLKDVNEIMSLLNTYSGVKIARMFGVSQSTISAIKTNRLWKER